MPTTFSSFKTSDNASRSMPSSVNGTGIASIPKSPNIIKCLSNPGTGHINLGLLIFFQGLGSAKRKFARTVW